MQCGIRADRLRSRKKGEARQRRAETGLTTLPEKVLRGALYHEKKSVVVPNSAGGSPRSCIPRVPAARRRGGSPWGQSCESAKCNPLRDDRQSLKQVAAYRLGRGREQV